MVEICDSGHDEIVFLWDKRGTAPVVCPLCKEIENVERLEEKLKELEDA